jgi:1-deoxy-D-xylulose-5-phosphate synthase
MRIPRGSGLGVPLDEELRALPIGRAEVLREGKDVVIIGYGTRVYPALAAAEMLEKDGITPTVVNARFAKPLDTELLDRLVADEPVVVTVEENARAGGFGSGVLEYLVDIGFPAGRVGILGIPDRYITHAPQSAQLEETGLTAEHIADKVRALIAAGRGAVGPASSSP